jgi:predicted CXXCH cytochrome family protein
MHSANGYVHPTDEMLGPIATLYGQYVKSGDMSGSASSSYLSLVPFVEGIADYATLASHSRNNDSVLSGPATSDRVSCVSCHRTHASAWPHMLRFDYGYEFSVINGNYPAIDHPDYGTWGSRAAVRSRGRTMAEVQAGYYDRAPSKFATYQRVLCNKCHAKD